MKNTILLLILFSVAHPLFAQEKKLLPIEITSNDFLLTYKYDNKNRIVERYFKNKDSAVRDSIAYIPLERRYVIYTSDDKGRESSRIYTYGKQRESLTWLKEHDEKDDTFNYQLDTLGCVQMTKGREWDGSWDGSGSNYISYKYTNGNLFRFYLDSKKQQQDFIHAMAPWEQQIFDEEISYDNQMGIFSQVDSESRWLLTSPIEEFYPMLHLKNNAQKIQEISESENVLRDLDEYPLTSVVYKYKYNKQKYPQSVVIKADNLDTNLSLNREFVIRYKDANTETQEIVEVEKLPSDKKLLPKRIQGTSFSIDYTYDSLNRFTSIKQIIENEIFRYDSIIYYPNNEGYRLINIIKDSEGKYSHLNGPEVKYTRKNGLIILGDEDGDRTEMTFTPTGMLSMMKSINADYDPDTSIDPPVIIGFIYDKNDNLVDMYLPNNASGDRVNRDLQMIEYMIMKYDNKNGIFKHVNRDCFMILYNQSEILNYYYYMGNNLILMEDEYDARRNYGPTRYKYNEYDYPIRMNEVLIQYIDSY